MAEHKKKLRIVAFMAMLIIVIQTGACGFILYPERKGRTSGRIDPGVAILDALLLIPGILPGVVAFAVDFVTGCIYIPAGRADIRSLEDGDQKEALARAGQALDIKTLERILSEHTGKPVHINADRVTVLRVNDPDFIRQHFVRLEQPQTVMSASGAKASFTDRSTLIR